MKEPGLCVIFGSSRSSLFQKLSVLITLNPFRPVKFFRLDLQMATYKFSAFWVPCLLLQVAIPVYNKHTLVRDCEYTGSDGVGMSKCVWVRLRLPVPPI